MKKIILALVWITLLIIGLVVWGTRLYDSRQTRAHEERDRHIMEMGLACIHHVHNLSASADANLKDFYTTAIVEPQKLKIEATLKCLQDYPLYPGGEKFSGFNTTLN
jgi:hypothetical protein